MGNIIGDLPGVPISELNISERYVWLLGEQKYVLAMLNSRVLDSKHILDHAELTDREREIVRWERRQFKFYRKRMRRIIDLTESIMEEK